MYIWSRVPCSYPPAWYGSPGSTPFPSICELLAAFLRSSLVFARSLQHFWLPASHLLGTCYLLDDLRSTHTPSKYLRATYSHIYMCFVSTFYLLPVPTTLHVFNISFLHTRDLLRSAHASISYLWTTLPHPHHTTGWGGGQYYGWPMTMARGGWNAGPYIYIYIHIL